jgi:hypothetical protein
MEQAATVRDPALAISALNAANRELRCILIALQVWAEDEGSVTDRRRIWSVLKAMADRRLMPLF